jgi:hypothetical protein
MNTNKEKQPTSLSECFDLLDEILNESAYNSVNVTLPSIPPKPISYVDIIKNKNKHLKT